MWMKVLFCAEDEDYCKRLSLYLDKRFGENLEIVIFRDFEKAICSAEEQDADVLVFGEEFKENVESHPEILKLGVVAILVSRKYEEEEAFRTIAKYQRGETIYQDLIDLYSSGKKVRQRYSQSGAVKNGMLTVFISACGGAGVSTVARAFAKKKAMYEKTLLIDLGIFASSYAGEHGQGGLSDVLIALQSRRNILPYKLASAVHQTEDRFYTYSPCENAADLLELSNENMRQMVEGVEAIGEYKTVVFDLGTRFSEIEIEVLKNADLIVYVNEDNNCSEEKACKFLEVLGKIDERDKAHLSRKLYLFQNKQKQNQKKNRLAGQMNPGGQAPYIPMETYQEIIDRIAQSAAFDDLEMGYAR